LDLHARKAAMKQVTVKFRVPIADELRGEASRVFQAPFATHLERRKDVMSQADLELEVVECHCGNGSATCILELTGSLNHLPVSHSAKAQRLPSTVMAGHGGVVGAIVGVALQASLSGAFGTAGDFPKLQQCINECVAKLLLRLDQDAGFQGSKLAQRWRAICRYRWIGAIVVLIPATIPYVLLDGVKGVLMILMGGWMLSIATFLLIHVSGLLFMPASFFSDEPSGQKALALSGTNSVLGLRVLCVLFTLVMLGVMAFAVIVNVGSYFEHRERKLQNADALYNAAGRQVPALAPPSCVNARFPV